MQAYNNQFTPVASTVGDSFLIPPKESEDLLSDSIPIFTSKFSSFEETDSYFSSSIPSLLDSQIGSTSIMTSQSTMPPVPELPRSSHFPKNTRVLSSQTSVQSMPISKVDDQSRTILIPARKSIKKRTHETFVETQRKSGTPVESSKKTKVPKKVQAQKLETQVKKLTEQNSLLTTKLDQSSATITRLQQEIEQLKKEKISLSGQLTCLRSKQYKQTRLDEDRWPASLLG